MKKLSLIIVLFTVTSLMGQTTQKEDIIKLRIEQNMLLSFGDRLLYGRKAGGGSESVRVQIPTNYKKGDFLQTLSTKDTIRINSTYKNDVIFGTLSLGKRGSLQTWEHRNSGYNWDITPYQEYQNNLLKRLGISITFPEPTVRYFSHLGEMEDYAFFTFGTADASKSWTQFMGRMFIQMSPSFCIVLYDTGNYDLPHAFENREYMVRTEKLTLDTEVAYFDHLIRNNLDIPWTGWYDYSGEDLQKLQEWDGANYILKFKDAAWVKRSNAEMGFVAKIPNFDRIQYNGEELSEDNIGSSYDACYGVELCRLYNPESIRMLFFINTEKEKDLLKCLEEACKYVSFDNSHVKKAPTREETEIKVLAPDTTTLELTPSDRMLYGRKAG